MPKGPWPGRKDGKPRRIRYEGHAVTIDGRALSLKAACRLMGVTYAAVVRRVQRGRSVQGALRLSVRPYRKVAD